MHHLFDCLLLRLHKKTKDQLPETFPRPLLELQIHFRKKIKNSV